MKNSNRIFALLLALAMTLAYMPALAFADSEGSGSEVTAAAEAADTVSETEDAALTETAGEEAPDMQVVTENAEDACEPDDAAPAEDSSGAESNDGSGAKGKKFTCVVSFNANTGAGTMKPQVWRKGHKGKLAKNRFCKKDCAFMGWALTADGEVAYTDGQWVVFTEDTELFAVWRPAKQSGFITEPEAVEGLVYDGEAHELIKAGESYGGTLYYYEGDEEPSADPADGWTTDAKSIQGTDAKDYSVWYMVDAAEGYAGVAPQKLEGCVIAAREVDIKWSDKALIYNKTEQAPEATAVDPVTAEPVDGVTVKVTGGGIEKGTYRASASLEDSNYSFVKNAVKSKYFLIYPKQAELTWVQDQTFEYDGEAHEPDAPVISGLFEGDECYVESYRFYLTDPDDPQAEATTVEEAVLPGRYYAYAFLSGSYSSGNMAHLSPDTMQYVYFEITKASVDLKLDDLEWTYGEAAKEPVVSGNTGDGKVTVKYEVGGEYTETVPTEAGTYNMIAEAEETDLYKGGVSNTATLTIKPADLRLCLSMDGWVYKSTPNEPELTGNAGEGSVTYKYFAENLKAKTETEIDPSADGWVWNPGLYRVEASVEATNNYKAGKASALFVVWKAVPDMTAPQAREGLSYRAEPMDLVTAGTVNDGLKMEYCVSDEYPGEDADWSEAVPQGEDAGTYSVWFRITGDPGYLNIGAMGPVNVTISPAVPYAYVKPQALNTTYDGKAHKLVTPGETDDGHFEYSLLPFGYSSEIPEMTIAGKYKVYYKLVGSKNYGTTYFAPITAEISKADPVYTAPVANDLTYNGDEQPLVSDGLGVKYSMDGSRYSNFVPEAVFPGEYVVNYRAGGGINYNTAEGSVTVTVKKAGLAPVAEIESWSYGEPPCEPWISDYGCIEGDIIDSDDVTFEYRAEGSDQYQEDVPTEVGVYYMHAVIAETALYLGATSEDVQFEITKAGINPYVFITGWKQGDEPSVPRVIGNKGGGDVRFLYKKDGSEEGFSETVPEEPGHYHIMAEVAETDNYLGANTPPFGFYIYKADPGITSEPSCRPDELVYMADDDGSGIAQQLVIPGQTTDENECWFEYCVTNSDEKPGAFAAYSRDIPEAADAGTYFVWYCYTEKRILLPDKKTYFDTPIVVTIDRAEINVDVNINGWTYLRYNVSANTPWLSEGSNPGDGYVTYEYINYADPEPEYSTVPPVFGSAGTDYAVRATVAMTANYYGGSDEASFTISPAPATAAVVFSDDLTYNGKYQELVKGAVAIGGDVKYALYSVDDAGEEHLVKNYSKYKPTAKDPALYRIYYTIEADANHCYEGVKHQDIIIDKADITPSVTVEDWTYGDEPKAPVVEGNKGGGEVIFTYFNSEGSEVSRPADSGEYTVLAEVAETDKYYGGSCSAGFTVRKTDLIVTANDYSITYGQEGKDGGASAEGLKNGDTLESLGTIDYKFGTTKGIPGFKRFIPYTAQSEPGEYDIVPSGLESANYNISYVNGTLTVGKAALIVTANPAAITYGDAAEPAGVSYEGFMNGEDETSLAGVLLYDIDYEQYGDAGIYSDAIHPYGLESDHYEFEYRAADLTVEPRPLALTWEGTSFVYDGEYHGPSVTAETLNEDKIIITPKGVPQKDAGSYTAWADSSCITSDKTPSKAGNYCIAEDDPAARCDYEITKAGLTVTAKNKTISLGQAPSNAGVTYSGLAAGDDKAAFDKQVRYSYNYKKNGRPGTYKITPSGIDSANYDVTYADGKLTVDDVQSVLLAQGTSSGNKTIRLTWNSVTGADKYEIYYAKCNLKGKIYKLKKVKTVKSGTLTFSKSGLKKGSCYKFKVVALKKGKKIATSQIIHVIAGNVQGKYTNAKSIKVNKKSVSVKKGKSVKLKASLTKVNKKKKLLDQGHAALYRYISSNTAVARVNGNGTVYGVSKGFCRVYVQSVNGLWKAVEVTVK